MYQLLNQSPLNFGGGMTFPEFRRVRDGLRLTVERVKKYRRENPRNITGGHLLLRLMGSIPYSNGPTDQVFNDKISDVALLFTQSLKMTSALSRGQLWRPGPFLGNKVQEVIIADTDQWDVKAGLERWEELSPIRYLYHPMTSLNMPVADDQFASTESGIAVISINIPMLASQYRAWRRANSVVDESPRTVGQFLQAYPLPNMLDSYADIAILNRLTNLYFGIESPRDTERHHTFFVTNWDKEVDSLLERWLLLASSKRWDFDTLVSHIPTVSSEDLHETLRLPEQAYSTQISWAVLLARVMLIAFLVQFNRNTDNQRNYQYLNYIRRHLQYIEGNGALRNALSAQTFDEIMMLIDRGIKPYL